MFNVFLKNYRPASRFFLQPNQSQDMKKYRKKPVVVEAVKWNGYNLAEIKKFTSNHADVKYDEKDGEVIADLFIHTLEGDMHASKGDYIIKGVHGEFYPCKPDVFAKTYEEVSDD